MKLILLCFVLTLTSLSVHALSCLPCDREACAKPSGCPGGLTDDVCGCCKVCARVYNETCGGPFGISGTCDSGLFCSKDPGLDDIASFNADGRCDCEAPSLFTTCGGCESTCNELNPTCATVCEEKCVCPDGMVRRSSTNKTCVERTECPECESPRVLSSCGSCQATCDNPSPNCAGDCEEGCVCPEGMIQKSSTNTTCVERTECSDCEEPRVFSPCSGHCQSSCDIELLVCTLNCVPGCVCPEGMVLRTSANRTCVPNTECPECESPKVLDACRGNCQPTCDDRYPSCTDDCVEGCVCPEGMLLQSATNNTCVTKEVCADCQYPRVYSECNGHCQPTCDSPYVICPEICSEGCVCPEGMIQKSSTNNTCVPKTECPRTDCELPRVYSVCNGHCQPTCDNPSPFCTKDCREGCICPEGTIQKSYTNNTCIQKTECPSTECEYPKVFSTCNGHCPRTCNNRDPVCIAVCRAGCLCPEGMVQRSLDDTTCIWESECPTETCEITECPAVASTTCSRDALISWVCEVENFRCSTFKWKQEMEAWMIERDCSYLRENPWDHAFQCGTGEIECKNRSARTVVYDAFNCPFVKCTDGQYRDPIALFTIWKQFATNHRQTMMSYQKAAASCSNTCD